MTTERSARESPAGTTERSARESPAGTTSQEPPVVAKVAAAIALLAAAGSCGFIAYRLLAARGSSLTAIQNPGVAHSTAGESDGSAPSITRKIPEVLPQIAMPDTAGAVHALSDWKGRPLVVNFWATWCDPCRREIPLLKKLRHERSADSLEVIGIAVDSPDAVSQYTRTIGIDYPVLIGEKDGLAAIEALGMETVFPFTVFADRQGRILTLKVGELHGDEAKVILDRLEDVDSGKLDLTAARQQISARLAQLEARR
jgi:thiol-disulfide isomerase/thioredoxin